MGNLSDELDIEVVVREPAEDRSRLPFKATPKTNPVNAIKVIKGVSSRRLRKEFPGAKGVSGGDPFWSPSYLLATSGQVSSDALKDYVESRSEKP